MNFLKIFLVLFFLTYPSFAAKDEMSSAATASSSQISSIEEKKQDPSKSQILIENLTAAQEAYAGEKGFVPTVISAGEFYMQALESGVKSLNDLGRLMVSVGLIAGGDYLSIVPALSMSVGLFKNTVDMGVLGVKGTKELVSAMQQAAQTGKYLKSAARIVKILGLSTARSATSTIKTVANTARSVVTGVASFFPFW